VPITQLRDFAADPVHGLVSVAQALGVEWEGSLEETVEFVRTRLRGDYAVDEFGFDPEFTTKIYLPVAPPACGVMVPGRGSRSREPTRRWFGAAGLQSRGHLATRRNDLAHHGL
jgi:hypothetical protein